jgi:hypothetical protein
LGHVSLPGIHALNQLRRQALPVGEDGRKILDEVPHVAAESDLSLRFEPGGYGIPAGDYGFSGLQQASRARRYASELCSSSLRLDLPFAVLSLLR